MSDRPRSMLLCLLAAVCLASAALTAVAAAAGERASAASARRGGGHHCVKHRTRAHPHARLCHAAKRAPTAHGPGSSATSSAGLAAPSAPTPVAPANGPVASSGGAPPVPGEAPAGEPPSVPHVQVSAFEYGLTLSRSTVPAGKVILEFVNGGQDEHNLNGVSGEGEPAFSFRRALSKEVQDQQVVMRSGSYTLFCSLPEHEAKGMKATLLVQ